MASSFHMIDAVVGDEFLGWTCSSAYAGDRMAIRRECSYVRRRGVIQSFLDGRQGTFLKER